MRQDATRQPALLRSEAVLLPALSKESARAALSQVRTKDKLVQAKTSDFQPVVPVMASVVTPASERTKLRTTGSMAGKALLKSVGAQFDSAQNNHFPLQVRAHRSGPARDWMV